MLHGLITIQSHITISSKINHSQGRQFVTKKSGIGIPVNALIFCANMVKTILMRLTMPLKLSHGCLFQNHTEKDGEADGDG